MTDLLEKKENFINRELLSFKSFSSDIIDAFISFDCDYFLPDDLKHFAYISSKIKIKEGRYCIGVFDLARMIEIAKIGKEDFVLSVGASFGYSSAILSFLAKAVLATEQDPEILKETEAKVLAKQIDNLVMFKSSGIKGYKEQAPYDVIFINDILSEILSTEDDLVSQLALNGRLVGAEKKGKIISAFMIVKTKENITKDYIFNFIQ